MYRTTLAKVANVIPVHMSGKTANEKTLRPRLSKFRITTSNFQRLNTSNILEWPKTSLNIFFPRSMGPKSYYWNWHNCLENFKINFAINSILSFSTVLLVPLIHSIALVKNKIYMLKIFFNFIWLETFT